MMNLKRMAQENNITEIKAALANGINVYENAENLLQIARKNNAVDVISFYETYFASIVGNALAH